MTAKKYPKAIIYAFEPDMNYFRLLKENCLLNKTSNVICINKSVTSVTRVVKKVGNKIDFIKSDCEGSEFEIFSNWSQGIKINNVVMEFHEYNGNNIQKLIEIFEQRSLKVRTYSNRGIKGLGILTASG